MHMRGLLLKTLEEILPEAWQIAETIFNNPEVGGQEYTAVQLLTKTLSKYNYAITTNYLNLPTAFKATLGSGKPEIYLLAEYDALPEIGHGCGHHLIAGASLGAALGLAKLNNLWSGTLVVLGTPAEETDGGKVLLCERGAFKNCDAALIFHPGQSAVLNISSQALEALEVVFLGSFGHSAGKNTEGNPLTALIDLFQEVFSYNKLNYPKQEIQGVIIEGGVTPNLIPEKTVARFYLRATTVNELKDVVNNFREMAERFAAINKTELTVYRFEPRYLPMNTNLVLAQVFKEQAGYLNIKMNTKKWQIIGSIDMGNVSWEVPAIHPYLPLGKGGVPAHTIRFAKMAGNEEGRQTMFLASKILALTVLELFTQPNLIEKMWQEHKNY